MMECLYLLLVVFHHIAGCSLEGDQSLKSITADLGGSVLLPCYCTDPLTKPQTLTWSFFRHNQFTEVLSDGRVQLFNDRSPANLSLLISDLREEDEGSYRCETEMDNRDITLTVKACTLSSQSEVTAHTRGSVLLSCYCTDPLSKPQTLTWKVYKNAEFTEVLSDSEYRGRVQLFNDRSPANLSLLISDLREEDEGTYRCETDMKTRDIKLTVKGCDLGNRDLVEVTGFVGESVMLPCSCPDLQSKPKSFTWEFIKTQTENNHFTEIFPKQTGQHRDRVRLTNQNLPGDFSLLISDLTKEDEGNYICIVNDKGKQFRLYISVKETSATTTITAAIAATTVSYTTNGNDILTPVLSILLVLLLLIVVGVVAIICWRRKGKRNIQKLTTEETSDTPIEEQKNKEEKQTVSDVVTYATVAHSTRPGPVPFQIEVGEKSEYAAIKTG